MSKPFFSVVTTTLNAEAYISSLIESINAQSFRSFEHIIVDAGSTDATLEIVKTKSPSAKLLFLQDSSMYEAINYGFMHARGVIYCYINADDMYLPDTLRIVHQLYLSKPFDFLVGGTLFVDHNHSVMYKYKPVVSSFDLIHRLHRIPFTQPSAFWSKLAFDALSGFDTRYSYCADTDYFLRALQLNLDFASTDKYLSVFMRHRSSLSSRSEEAMLIEHNSIFAKLKVSDRPRELIHGNWKFFVFLLLVYIKNITGIIRRQYYFKMRGIS